MLAGTWKRLVVTGVQGEERARGEHGTGVQLEAEAFFRWGE